MKEACPLTLCEYTDRNTSLLSPAPGEMVATTAVPETHSEYSACTRVRVECVVFRVKCEVFDVERLVLSDSS